MEYAIKSEQEMRQFGDKIGQLLRGGEFIELVGDVGAGKTTFTKGLALGLGVEDIVQSPTFTISRVYEARDGIELRHYDFYRLNEAGIMSDDLAESVASNNIVTVVEWSGLIKDALPSDRLIINFESVGENDRALNIEATSKKSQALLGGLE